MLEMLNVVQRETDVPRWGTDRVFDTFWYMEQRRDGAVLIPAKAIKDGPVYLVLGMAQSIGSLLPPPPVQVGRRAWHPRRAIPFHAQDAMPTARLTCHIAYHATPAQDPPSLSVQLRLVCGLVDSRPISIHHASVFF
jgi:hypothetical protein